MLDGMIKKWLAETRTEYLLLGAMAVLILLASVISLAWQRNTAVREREAALEKAEKAIAEHDYLLDLLELVPPRLWIGASGVKQRRQTVHPSGHLSTRCFHPASSDFYEPAINGR